MPPTYTISAAPTLFTEGAYRGKLKGVTFTAVAANEMRQWFTRNCGQFETTFTRIMPSSIARTLVEALMHGDDIEFPGTYREDQFERGFVFEWSPVYFVVPPDLIPEGSF